MSCCNFSGVDNRSYNLDPETERITEAIYSDWTEAAGHPDKPLSPVPDIGRRANGIDRYENEFGRVAAEGCQTDGDCPEGQRCNRGRCEITTRMRMRGPRIPGRPDFGRAGGPWELGGVGTWTPFDGGAVKKNWVPLVVLGLSLVVGIAISEYGFKKIVK